MNNFKDTFTRVQWLQQYLRLICCCKYVKKVLCFDLTVLYKRPPPWSVWSRCLCTYLFYFNFLGESGRLFLWCSDRILREAHLQPVPIPPGQSHNSVQVSLTKSKMILAWGQRQQCYDCQQYNGCFPSVRKGQRRAESFWVIPFT